MHLKRTNATMKIPLQRKGTKYVVRTASHVNDSISVLVALRDMLKIAKTLREVKKIINTGSIKINGRVVTDPKQSIKLFNIFQADKNYVLKILPTKRFTLEETKESDKRLCKITNKRLISPKKYQLNLHDGSNVITDKSFLVNDSIYLSFDGKIISHTSLDKAKSAFIISGRYTGLSGNISSIENGSVKIKLDSEDAEVKLPKSHIIIL